MKKLTTTIIAFIIILFLGAAIAIAGPPTKSKFYDFSEQLIDGEIRKPTGLYTDSRQKVKFERLLKLKRSFMRELFDTSKEKIFK
jgi:hypothetical protein